MSTIDTMCPTVDEKAVSTGMGRTAARPGPHAIRRVLAFYLRWREKRESRRVLRDLTDDQLLDIGLTRREAMTESRKSFFWN
ncbi:MAG: DUF1127 domain-containing protein [Rhizobium sp.]|uniref:DUF1127 domain-containing protein n=1 Tax=Rhizobium sp. SYY.PMSO TaxID=3382192 RepID=UPI000DE09E0B